MHVWQWVAIIELGLIFIGVILGAVAVVWSMRSMRQNAQAEARTQHILEGMTRRAVARGQKAKRT